MLLENERRQLFLFNINMISDFGSYLNGEVITIDGGEWLKGAGQFNMLDKIPNTMWSLLERTIRKKK